MDDEERPGPPPLTAADVQEQPSSGSEPPGFESPGPPPLTEGAARAQPLFERPSTDDEPHPGPPPLTEAVPRKQPPTAYELPRRLETERLALDRSSTATASPQRQAALPPAKPPAKEVILAEDVARWVASDVGSLLGSGLALVLALVVCLLPVGWRERIERPFGWLPLRLATMLTGGAEVTVTIFLGLRALIDFLHARLDENGTILMDQVIHHDIPPQTMYELHQALGATMYLAFFLSPGGVLVAFFVLEGATRILSAFVAREARGTLLLWLIEQARWLAARLVQGLPPKPLPADTIVRSAEGILGSIRSAHSYGWDRMTTLRFEDRLYLVEEQSVTPDRERPYLYRVREAPMGHIVRKLVEYHPDPALWRGIRV